MSAQTGVLKAGAGGVPLTAKRESLTADAFRRLVRNRAAVMGGVIVLLLVLVAIFADFIAPKPFEVQILIDNNKVPQWLVSIFPTMTPYAKLTSDYLLGADYVGRDLFSRLVYGSRVSLSVAFIGPIISLLIGVVYGSVSGFFGGRTDNLMMRVVDVLYAFPTLLFVILLMAFFRSTFSQPDPGSFAYGLSQLDARMGGLLFIFMGIGFTAWETMARLTRGQVLSVREKEFVEAARTVGAGNGRIMFRHILPNIVGPLVVYETLAIPTYITRGVPVVHRAGVNLHAVLGIDDFRWWTRRSTYPNQRFFRRWRWPSPCSPSTSSATGCATRSTRACEAPSSRVRIRWLTHAPTRGRVYNLGRRVREGRRRLSARCVSRQYGSNGSGSRFSLRRGRVGADPGGDDRAGLCRSRPPSGRRSSPGAAGRWTGDLSLLVRLVSRVHGRRADAGVDQYLGPGRSELLAVQVSWTQSST
jgi:oligopeptide transport system permease protein